MIIDILKLIQLWVTALWVARIGPYAFKNIAFTLMGNYFITYLTDYNYFLTLIPLYAVGLYIHYLLGIQSPGSIMFNKMLKIKGD